MKNIARILSVLLAVSMLFALAACGGNTDATSSLNSEASVDDASKGNITNSDVITSIPTLEDFSGHVSINDSGSLSSDKTSGVRYDKDYNLLYKPEDVGTLSNPIVKGLVSPAPDDEWYAQEIGWKEEAYDMEYDMDTCAWDEREMKWIAAFVGGTSYDVLTRVNFPTVVIKGLLEPLDEYLPIEDERYFITEYGWDGHVYGMKAKSTNYTYRDAGELYGVWFNKDLFEDNGVETPLELYEKGEWTIDAMIDLAEELTFDSDRDGANDYFGWRGDAPEMFTIGNGAKTIEIDRTGKSGNAIELVWNNPAYIRGLENLIDIKAFSTAKESFSSGKVAMYAERIQCGRTFSKTSPEYKLSFEAIWVPFPKGQDGYGVKGSISVGSETVCIGKGAKNIEGAKVWICADICKFDYVSPEGATMMMGIEQDTLDRALAVEQYILNDPFSGIGTSSSIMQKVWAEIKTNGAAATIEKFTPQMEQQIKTVLADTDLE